MKIKLLIKFIISACLVLGTTHTFAEQTIDASVTQWGYSGETGPENWAILNNDFAICATGNQQSPIDIPTKLVPISGNLSINYQRTPLIIVNDGDTTLNLNNQKIIYNDGHSLQINFPERSDQVPVMEEFITFNGTKYRLLQLHFHVPSEHKVAGKEFPMEIHFVHQSDDGKVAVIGVFATIGDNTNQELQDIINNIPSTKGQLSVLQDAFIDPSLLLPSQQIYYNYMGSLTTPPCSEGLNWIVMQEPISISYQQLEDFKYLLDGGNARPIQSLNDREVMSSDY